MNYNFIDSYNMTHSEFYHLNGTLSAERTEQALDTLARMEAMQDALGYTTDAQAGYVDEDFLCDVLGDLRTLAKFMRGENRKELLSIIERISDSVLEQVRNGEYGQECLGKIKLALA